jgi:Predicted hydrolases or acyltransferases (alpha/beta hydrolase superfamily)
MHVPAHAASLLRSVWTTVDGLRIHARVSDTPAVAPPIVFVHGLGVSSRYMEPTLARLATRRVAALDLAGFGRSDAPPRPFTLGEHAQLLLRWLDARGIVAPILVGNSYGCQVIAECVSRAPACARGLVLNAPTIDPAHRSALVMIARVLADVPREPWRLAGVVTRDYWRAGPRCLLVTLADALRDRIEEKLPSIAQPTLVVCGARDPVVTVRWASECARLVGIDRNDAAGGTMQCVATAAHALPYDDPDTFAAIIANFAEHGVRQPAVRA